MFRANFARRDKILIDMDFNANIKAIKKKKVVSYEKGGLKKFHEGGRKFFFFNFFFYRTEYECKFLLFHV